MICYTFAKGAADFASTCSVLSPNDLPASKHPSGSISSLPGVLGTATSWLVCDQLWPHREAPDTSTAEIHFAVHADHSFAIVNDHANTLGEMGIFRGTLFAQAPGPLHWMRPNSANSVEYVGLRWVVLSEHLEMEVQRLVVGLGELAGSPGVQITCR